MVEGRTAYCHHYHRAMSVFSPKWTPEITRALLAGSTRFSEIAAAIPNLSDRLLSERLKHLEAEGVVTRDVIPDTPVRVEYRLTEKGRGLAAAVDALSAWAQRWVTPAEAEASG